MAIITNIEDNLELIIDIGNIVDKGRTEYETWVTAFLKITSETVNLEIGDNIHFMLNVFETKRMIENIENLIISAKEGIGCSFSFGNIEANFEINMENALEDDVIEVEIWVNLEGQTNGNIVGLGYAEGVRFVSYIPVIENFVESLKNKLQF